MATLSTIVKGGLRNLASPKILRTGVQTRHMATEQQILMRINSTKNISKITKSMKMVSASKLRGDQNRLEAGKPFNKWTKNLIPAPAAIEDYDTANLPKKPLFICLTSDKGLCGGVNSVIARGIRDMLNVITLSGAEPKILVVGEKGRSQIYRMWGEYLVTSVTEVQLPYNFNTACAIASEASKIEADSIHILYNEFKSAISYIPTIQTVPVLNEAKEEPLFSYDFEPDNKNEVLDDMQEFSLASNIYYGLLEGATSEQSSRMNAMENASKNADEMIDSLTLIYNRARQARITTELIEIISGASALDG